MNNTITIRDGDVNAFYAGQGQALEIEIVGADLPKDQRTLNELATQIGILFHNHRQGAERTTTEEQIKQVDTIDSEGFRKSPNTLLRRHIEAYKDKGSIQNGALTWSIIVGILKGTVKVEDGKRPARDLSSLSGRTSSLATSSSAARPDRAIASSATQPLNHPDPHSDLMQRKYDHPEDEQTPREEPLAGTVRPPTIGGARQARAGRIPSLEDAPAGRQGPVKLIVPADAPKKAVKAEKRPKQPNAQEVAAQALKAKKEKEAGIRALKMTRYRNILANHMGPEEQRIVAILEESRQRNNGGADYIEKFIKRQLTLLNLIENN